MPMAYGYVRWSTDRQEDGDTRKRQLALINGWLARNKTVKLDVSLGAKGLFVDEGMTGFVEGGARNLDNYQLGAFIKLAESGRVESGSMLLIENTDRLSRESSVFALHLITRLLVAGVVVVTLAPEKEFRSNADLGALLPVLVGADRAHDESKTKKHRAVKAWKTKREAVAEGTALLSTRVPAWCRVVGASRKNNRLVGGKIEAVPAKVEVVRRLFRLALEGHGCRAISLRLNTEKVPTLTGRGDWGQARVYQILRSRAVLGEYQPHLGVQGSKKKGKPQTRTATGDAIEGYYPVIIDRETFDKVAVALDKRACYRGRRTAHVNLFSGMLRDARTGERFSYYHAKVQPPTIVPNSDSAGLGHFNADVLEEAVLAEMAEVKATDVFEERDIDGEVAKLSARLAEKRDERDDWRRQLKENPKLLRTVGDLLTGLEDEVEELTRQLTDSQRKAASPLSEAWGEFVSVAALLKKDNSPETRLRVQTLLRNLVEGMTLLIVGNGRKKRKRVAVVEVRFVGGASRLYEIIHIHAGPHNKASWHSTPSKRHEPGHTRDLTKDWRDIERWILQTW